MFYFINLKKEKQFLKEYPYHMLVQYKNTEKSILLFILRAGQGDHLMDHGVFSIAN